jgi:hypothetical protein
LKLTKFRKIISIAKKPFTFRKSMTLLTLVALPTTAGYTEPCRLSAIGQKGRALVNEVRSGLAARFIATDLSRRPLWQTRRLMRKMDTLPVDAGPAVITPLTQQIAVGRSASFVSVAVTDLHSMCLATQRSHRYRAERACFANWLSRRTFPKRSTCFCLPTSVAT